MAQARTPADLEYAVMLAILNFHHGVHEIHLFVSRRPSAGHHQGDVD